MMGLKIHDYPALESYLISSIQPLFWYTGKIKLFALLPTVTDPPLGHKGIDIYSVYNTFVTRIHIVPVHLHTSKICSKL